MSEYDEDGGANDGYYNKGQSSPQNSPKKGGTKNRSAALVPVTILQIQESQQQQGMEDFIINNQPVTQVSIVGLIISVNNTATHLNYTVDDGSGQIAVRIWTDQEETNDFLDQSKEQWVEGKYVRVVGNIRAFGTKKNLVGYRLVVVEDFNELTYHYLDALHTHLVCTKEPGVAAGSPKRVAYSRTTNNNNNTNTNSNLNKNSNFNNNNNNNNRGQGQQQPQQHQQQDKFHNQKVNQNDPYQQQQRANDPRKFSPLQNAIIQTIGTCANPDIGMHINDICKALQNQASVDEIKRQVQRLAELALLFTTRDKNHFGLTGEE